MVVASGESHTTNNGEVSACELRIQAVDFLVLTCPFLSGARASPDLRTCRWGISGSTHVGENSMGVMGNGTPSIDAEKNADGLSGRMMIMLAFCNGFSNQIQRWTVPRHHKMALVMHRLGRNWRGPWRVMRVLIRMQGFTMMEL